MAKINTSSIQKKIKSYTNSSEFKERVNAEIGGKHVNGGTFESGVTIASADEIANTFIGIMQGEMASTGLSASLTSSASPAADGVYQISISFSGNLSRTSLCPEKFGGIDNIIALFNNGYNAGGVVYGTWKGERIRSRPTRPPGNFVDSAVNSFMGGYANEYHIKDIDVNPIFNT